MDKTGKKLIWTNLTLSRPVRQTPTARSTARRGRQGRLFETELCAVSSLAGTLARTQEAEVLAGRGADDLY
jgi:hypothetical protein